jgi:alkanesulfonate monooxygenase SsuD/methylene tetrahydromethanopterin reductase-like flavin-dependent oxidoreductase (luciferase family)
MTSLSIAVWGTGGLTWSLWKRFVAEVEPLGFAGLYFIDSLPHILGSYMDSLEPMTALTYLADHSQRMQLGTMVALMTARDPVMLARQAVALDDLCGGRFVLGLGAGGQSRMFGYNLGELPSRFTRLEEGLQVITRLLCDDEPVSFVGKFYQLEAAMVLPKPQRKGKLPILVGGVGPKRTLPLVARYADAWQPKYLTPEDFRERSALLDELLRAEGRPSTAVKRTLGLRVVCWRTPAELDQRVSWLRRLMPMLASLPSESVIDVLRSQFAGIFGTPETIVEQMRAYAAVGVEEIILEWVALDDFEGLRLIAEEVLPHI